MDARLAEAGSADALIASLVSQLEEFIEDEPAPTTIYEMVSASRHSEEIRGELAELYRRWRAHLADALRAKEEQGVVTLAAEPEHVASILFALGDGLGLQIASDPDWDSGPTLEVGVATAKHLLGA
jgi:hypothetical protein